MFVFSTHRKILCFLRSYVSLIERWTNIISAVSLCKVGTLEAYNTEALLYLNLFCLYPSMY